MNYLVVFPLYTNFFLKSRENLQKCKKFPIEEKNVAIFSKIVYHNLQFIHNNYTVLSHRNNSIYDRKMYD